MGGITTPATTYVPVFTPGPCYYLCQKKGRRCDWVKMWSWNLVLGGRGWEVADTITRILMRKDRRAKVGDMRTETKMRERERKSGERGWGLKMLNCWLWRWRKGPRAKECVQPVEDGKGKKTASPAEPLEGMELGWYLNFKALTFRIVRLKMCCFKLLNL